MSTNEASYRDKKVMSIGIVKELTGLSERQIRYYEKRSLLFPDRTNTGIRKYSVFRRRTINGYCPIE